MCENPSRSTVEAKTAKYTPGPWHTRNSHGQESVYGPSDEPIANLFLASGQVTGNANLIKAAPELLAALANTTGALDRARNYEFTNAREIQEHAETILAKAEGRE